MKLLSRPPIFSLSHWTIPSIALLALISLSNASSAQQEKSEVILSFGKGWAAMQDYGWERETFTRIKGSSKPGLKIVDTGQIRVGLVKYEAESLVFVVDVIKCQFEKTLMNEPPVVKVSPLQGKRLPPVWFHWALGFSLDMPPDNQTVEQKSNQQASQILELLDFRGFIPDKPAPAGAEWSLRIVPDHGDSFKFKEELERRFTSNSIEKKDNAERCKVTFVDKTKITPTEKVGNWEETNREGVYWFTPASHLVEAAEWKSESSESLKFGDMSNVIFTTTKVKLARLPQKSNNQKKNTQPKLPELKSLPLPPR